MLIYNVFGRHIGVQRKNDRWLVFRADLTERKFSRLYDIAILDDMAEGEIAGWVTFSMKPLPSVIQMWSASNKDLMDSITLSPLLARSGLVIQAEGPLRARSGHGNSFQK